MFLLVLRRSPVRRRSATGSPSRRRCDAVGRAPPSSDFTFIKVIRNQKEKHLHHVPCFCTTPRKKKQKKQKKKKQKKQKKQKKKKQKKKKKKKQKKQKQKKKKKQKTPTTLRWSSA
ncbi:uncharacterized protein LOC134107893 [Pungitius pungitius]|uniref:uncharacterized protein LOC134107893 n=1 Tax=Pungitius pungitius TaxID=134920 RepID=UPI002E10AAE6